MEMKNLNKIKDTLCKEIDKIADKGDINAQDLDHLYKLTDVVKNIGKIEMLEEEGGGYSERGGYSRGGDWEARGRFGRGEYDERGGSYAPRGQHYVRGHYSRDGGGSYGEGGGYSQGGGYSRHDGHHDMMGMMDGMMGNYSGADRERAMRMYDEMMRR